MTDDQLHEYERAIVGACKRDSGLMDTHALQPAELRDPNAFRTLSAIRRIVDSGRTVDDLSLVDELRGKDVPLAYVTDLPETTVANIAWYVAQIREAALRRRIQTFAATITEIASRADLGTDEALDFIERAFDTATGTERLSNVWLKDVLRTAVDDLLRRIQNPGGYTGISSGIQTLDAKTDGFQPGDLIIVAARPSLGKTAFAVTLAVNISVRGGTPSGFFSAEMSDVLIAQRFLANAGRFDLGRLRAGVMKTSDSSKILDAANEMFHEQVILNATPGIKLVDLQGSARSMARRGAQILFVDYLTLISHGDPKTPRHERVGEVTKALKNLARRLDLPVVALSQLARTAEGKEPSLSELRQSGEIEEDADLVLLLHRERKELAEAVPTRIIVAKNRNGPCGDVPMMFYPATGRFEAREGGDR